MAMVVTRLASASLPPGRRIYAIGDVHGCVDQLAALHAAIDADAASRPAAQATLLYLGDYVDRGPDVAGTIGLLIGRPARPGAACVYLMGNHERMLLDALETGDRRSVELFLANGGAASLESWGIDPARPAADWLGLLPPAHLRFLRGLELQHRAGGYLFVHAGIRPGVPLDRQNADDLIWIREPFLSSTAEHGAVVVHGHTPRPDPEIRRNRIGIDTGAVYGGPLTCAVLEDDRLDFLQT